MVSSSIPHERRGFMDLATGLDRSLKVHGRAGDTSGSLGWMLEGYHLRTDGFKELQGGGLTGFDVSDVIAKVRYRTAQRFATGPPSAQASSRTWN